MSSGLLQKFAKLQQAYPPKLPSQVSGMAATQMLLMPA
jgi:hypothetical protein